MEVKPRYTSLKDINRTGTLLQPHRSSKYLINVLTIFQVNKSDTIKPATLHQQ